MTPKEAYRAIILLIASDKEGYNALIRKHKDFVRCKYYNGSKKPICGKLSIMERKIYLDNGQVIECKG